MYLLTPFRRPRLQPLNRVNGEAHDIQHPACKLHPESRAFETEEERPQEGQIPSGARQVCERWKRLKKKEEEKGLLPLPLPQVGKQAERERDQKPRKVPHVNLSLF